MRYIIKQELIDGQILFLTKYTLGQGPVFSKDANQVLTFSDREMAYKTSVDIAHFVDGILGVGFECRIHFYLSLNYKCAVCESRNVVGVRHDHYHRVCSDHLAYGGVFQLDKLKLSLGYIKELPEAKCSICDDDISLADRESMSEMDFSKTCLTHRWLAKYFRYADLSHQYRNGEPFSLNGELLINQADVKPVKEEPWVIFAKKRKRLVMREGDKIRRDIREVLNQMGLPSVNKVVEFYLRLHLAEVEDTPYKKLIEKNPYIEQKNNDHMIITRDNVANISHMELSQILGTLWMMQFAPEAAPFIANQSELKRVYEIVKDENLKRFGVNAVAKLLEQLKGAIDKRPK